MLEAQGKPAEAEDKYREALGMTYSIYGEDAIHTKVVSVFNHLGIVVQAQGKLAEADVAYRKALDVTYSIYRQKAVHPKIVSALNQLGLIR